LFNNCAELTRQLEHNNSAIRPVVAAASRVPDWTLLRCSALTKRSQHPVGCEIAIRQRSVCETTRDNAAATRDDQAMQEQVTMHRRVVRASRPQASDERDAMVIVIGFHFSSTLLHYYPTTNSFSHIDFLRDLSARHPPFFRRSMDNSTNSSSLSVLCRISMVVLS
jgi:hypothetical protein